MGNNCYGVLEEEKKLVYLGKNVNWDDVEYVRERKKLFEDSEKLMGLWEDVIEVVNEKRVSDLTIEDMRKIGEVVDVFGDLIGLSEYLNIFYALVRYGYFDDILCEYENWEEIEELREEGYEDVD